MDEDFLREMGRLTVAAGRVELIAVTRLYFLHGGTDLPRFWALIGHQSFEGHARSIDQLVADLTDWEPGAVARETAWVRRARQFMDARNRMLHRAWVTDPDGTELSIHIRTRKLGSVVTAADLRQLAEEGEAIVQGWVAEKLPPRPPNDETPA